MAPQRTDRIEIRRRTAAIALALVILILAVPGGYSFNQDWRSGQAGLSFAQAEESGAVYLRPLTQLLVALVQAQHAAVVSGAAPGADVAAQVAAVDAADRQDGSALNTTTAWTDLRSHIEALDTQHVSGSAALTAYDQATQLAVALITQVGTSSNLMIDPDFDSMYLIYALVQQVPVLIVNSGLTADLASRAGSARTAVCDAPQCVPEVYAARQQISAAAAALNSDLQSAYSMTNNPALGPALLGGIDAIRQSVTQIAPGADFIDLPTVVPSPSVADSQSTQVLDAVMQLDDKGLTQLRDILAGRVATDETSRMHLAVGGIAGVVLALSVFVAATTRRRRKGEALEEPQTAPEAEPRLLDVRDLLEPGELVSAGSAASGRHVRRSANLT